MLPDLDRAADGLARGLAASMTRRSLLGRLGAWMLVATGGAAVAAAARPEDARGFHFCGHIWTTGSCPSPYELPRIDAKGYPLRPADGRPIDNLGRLVSPAGLPVDERGQRLLDPDGRALDPAPRTKICEDWVPERFGIEAVTQGVWYRCCNRQIRKLVDCCSTHRIRVNGDRALVGYCYRGRYVFCVMYYETGMPC
ncbi:MAG TPA: hypothetical protein VML35_04060 [Gaiellaceae bacterium]|nr:hypothetical protein [Gaiellaceae bacterium]